VARPFTQLTSTTTALLEVESGTESV